MLIALGMVLGMIPMGALAADRLIASNGETRYFDGTGAEVGAGGAWQVATSKMAAPTDTENEYEITLRVTTRNKIQEVTKAVGADVVLALDASTSMDFIADGDKVYDPSENAKKWANLHGRGYTTRWEKTLEAAKVFIDTLLAQGKDNRVAVVVYGGANEAVGGTAEKPASHVVLKNSNGGFWFTSAGELYKKINYPAVSQSTIKKQSSLAGKMSLRKALMGDGGTAVGATNAQAGFWGAEYALHSARKDALPYTVFMSDGMTNRKYTDGPGILHEGKTVYDVNGGQYAGTGSSGALPAAQQQLARLQKNTGCQVYGLAFDVASDSGVFASMDPNKRFAYNSESGQSVLNDIMKAITTQIELAIEPWTVEDPMTAWVKLDTDSLKDNDYVTVAEGGGSFRWDLMKANADKNYVYNEQDRTYTFTMSYRVRIDPESVSAWLNPDGTYAGPKATNGATGLSFRLKIDGVEQFPAYAPFTVPTVNVKLYRVSFYDHDQTFLKAETVLYGGGATPPNNPVHQGMRFEGWNGNYTSVTTDESVYAKCVPNTYIVTYYVDNEEYDQISDVPGGTAFNTLRTPKDPAKESGAQYDYTFTGWKAADGNYGDTVVRDRRYDAQFQAKTRSYTVTFLDKDDGELSVKSYEYGTTIGHIPTPPELEDTAYASYEFAGWTVPQGKTYTTASPVREDMVFTASYTETGKRYTVLTQGDEGVDTITPSQAYPAGSGPVITWTLKPGYELVKVGTDKGSVGSGKVTFSDLTADDHVTVNTGLKEYTVTFKAPTEEGGPNEEIQRSAVPYGTRVYAPTEGFVQSYTVEHKEKVQVGTDEKGEPIYEERVVSIDTYVFTAWEPGNENYGIDNLTSVDRDMTFTARYEKDTENRYLVRFLDEDEETVLFAEYYDKDAVVKAPGKNPEKAGDPQFSYTFAGWIPQGQYALDTPVAAEMDFVASYTARVNTYPVTFIVTGGPEGQVQVGEVQQVPYGGAAVLPDYTLPEGYHFTSEWSENYKNIAKAETVTRAIARNTYTVKFYLDGNQEPLKTENVPYGNAATAPQVTPGVGRTFNNDWTPAYDKITADLDVHGTTSPLTYTVQFQYEDGTAYKTLTPKPEYGENVSARVPAGPAKEATETYRYEFKGWVPASGNYTLDGLKSVVQDMYFKASYEEIQIPYSVVYQDENGNVLQGLGRADYAYGAAMDPHPAGPVKADTAQFHYEFDRWVAADSGYQDAATVTRNMVFKASYTSTQRSYTVTLTIDNGTASGGGTFAYGKDVTVSWMPEVGYHVANVTRNGDSLAVVGTSYTERGLAEDVAIRVTTEKNLYSVKFLMDDGVTVYKEGTVLHGDSFPLPENPAKGEDAGYSYRFSGWIPADNCSLEMLASVPHDLVFKASFASTAFTYSFSVNYVVQEDPDNIPDAVEEIESMSSQTDVDVSVNATAQPLTSVPPDYKLINSTANSEKVSFDGDRKANVSNPAKNDRIAVTYTYGLKGKAGVNINYILTDGVKDENGAYVVLKTLGSESVPYRENDAYDVTGKVETFDAGHAMYTRQDDSDALAGKLEGTETATVNVYYTANDYDFLVKYHNDYTNTEIAPAEGLKVTAAAPYGTELDRVSVARFLENENWLNAMKPSGYNDGTFAAVTVSEDAGKNIVTVHYAYTPSGGGSGPVTYRVTVRYKDVDTGKTLANDYTSGRMTAGSHYDVSEYAALSISGYTVERVEGDVSGRLTADIMITVWYAADTEIESPEVPLGPDSGTGPDLEIPEDETPKSDLPPVGREEDGTIIVDEDVPMGNLPQTGSTGERGASPAMGAIAFAATVAAAGLAFVTGRKRKED